MSKDVSKYVRYLAAERDAGRMYRALAQLTEGDPQQARCELASIEDRHAAHWEQMIRDSGHEVPADTGKLDPTSGQLVGRARRMSLHSVLPELEAAERDAQGTYDHEPDALPGMAEDEHLHAQVLQSLRPHPEASPARGLRPSRHWFRQRLRPGRRVPFARRSIRPSHGTAQTNQAPCAARSSASATV